MKVSHSQFLCRAGGLDEVRPLAAGYVVEIRAIADKVTTYRVHSADGGQGALWHVVTPLGSVWAQSLARHEPAPDHVARAIVAAQKVRPPATKGPR